MNKLIHKVLKGINSYFFFHNSLPNNLRLSPESEYSMFKYWQSAGEPRDFNEGLKRNMWTKLSDGWHAGSIAINPNVKGEYEGMKPLTHSTLDMEINGFYYNPLNKNNDFILNYIPTVDSDMKHWRYIPKNLVTTQSNILAPIITIIGNRRFH